MFYIILVLIIWSIVILFACILKHKKPTKNEFILHGTKDITRLTMVVRDLLEKYVIDIQIIPKYHHEVILKSLISSASVGGNAHKLFNDIMTLDYYSKKNALMIVTKLLLLSDHRLKSLAYQ